ncbi:MULTISPECIES: hypothetical protein [unclassified Streptomyces]|uniref:hypothetical protein n=1 Tax=unclassified Streptomyces TaxID=2593676 RepID=UPI00093B0D61|nr:hypothetical protein [Streptomyces sp. TSRI0107]OKJ90684.1 hypothetical protein AMK31_02885 [Streptomyces sp. TSRI0107]
MTSFLLFNFGTFVETNRFKKRALDGALVGQDLMDVFPPRALLVPGGVRSHSAAGTTTISFLDLTLSTWKSSVGTGAAGKKFSEAFRGWMGDVVGGAPDVVYLAGHQSGQRMWWQEEDPNWVADFTDLGKVSFQEYNHATGTASEQVSVDATPFRKQCKLVFGFGCNICAGGNLSHYQQYFQNGASKPVFLGWNGKILIPRSGWPSINNAFFDALDAHASAAGSGAPATDRIDWFYGSKQTDLISAWGVAVAAYRGHAQKRLWDNARAVASDGQVFKFSFDEKTKTVVPIPE